MSASAADPWLVLRTRSRQEGIVAASLRQREVRAYLPQRRCVRTGPGPRRTTESPWFPGFVFVQPRPDQYEGLRCIRGSCGFVLAGSSRPATLPDSDLAALRLLAGSAAAISVEPGLVAGRRVRIVAGPLAGIEGELVRMKNHELLVINVGVVGSSVRIELDRDAVVAI